jgi:outer membrane protein TolC
MSYEADIFLKNRDKTRASKKLYEKSKLDERAAYISIASAVGATYFNIIKADKLIELQEKIIKSRREIYDLMTERNKEGLTSTADVVKANKDYILAGTELIELEKARTFLLKNLAVLIGETPNNINNLQRKSYDNSYLVKIPESVSSQIIDQSPDFLAAEKMLEKAGIDVRVAKKEFLPNIDIVGLLAFSSSALNSTFNWSGALGALGGGAVLNIFSGGKKIANLRIQKNTYEQLLQTYYKTNLTAIQEVNDALVSLKQDDKKYKTSLQAYNLEKKGFGYSKEKYLQGVISYMDLIQREENLLVLDKLVVQNKLDCNISYITLYKATGAQI